MDQSIYRSLHPVGRMPLLNYVLKDFYASGVQDAEVTNHCGKIHSQVKAGFTYHQGKVPANNINSESN